MNFIFFEFKEEDEDEWPLFTYGLWFSLIENILVNKVINKNIISTFFYNKNEKG